MELELEIVFKGIQKRNKKRRTKEIKMTTKAKFGQIHLYCAYLTSIWFESIDDLINFDYVPHDSMEI